MKRLICGPFVALVPIWAAAYAHNQLGSWTEVPAVITGIVFGVIGAGVTIAGVASLMPEGPKEDAKE